MVCELTPEMISEYKNRLQGESIQKATMYKYLHDLETLQEYLHGEELTQEKLDGYPEWLVECKHYKKNSVNATVVSAKKFITAMGWQNLQTRSFFITNQERKKLKKYVSQEDYEALVREALKQGKKCLAMMLQTLCHMDIRYSEFVSLTVESVEQGYVEVERMGRKILLEIPAQLKNILLEYAREARIGGGMIFRTAKGKPIDRSYVWRQLKSLCRALGMDEDACTLVHFKMPVVSDYYPYVELA